MEETNIQNLPSSFWDSLWAEFEPFELDCEKYKNQASKCEICLIHTIGDVRHKKILELGGGSGALTVFLAKIGARITVIDSSPVAVEKMKAMIKKNNLESSIEVFCLNANEAEKLGETYDMVIGEFILHHIEPFMNFSVILSKLIKKNGKGVFLENSSRNRILMCFRNRLVGKFGIPKYGDQEEYPFELKEIEILKRKFIGISVFYPEFMFFSLLSTYIFRKNKIMGNIFNKLDELCYAYLPILRKYSYRQIIELKN